MNYCFVKEMFGTEKVVLLLKSRGGIVIYLSLTPNVVIKNLLFKRNVCLPKAEIPELPLRFFLPCSVIGGS